MTGPAPRSTRPPLTPGAFAAVAAGGACGAGLRHTLTLLAPPTHGVGWTVLAINVVGCFALALLPGWRWIAQRPQATLVVGPGLLGGFTTLSAFAEQSRALTAHGRTTTAAVYAGLTVLLCVGAVLLGRWVSQRVATPEQPQRTDTPGGHE